MKRNKPRRSPSANFNDPQKGFDTTSKRIVFSLLIVILAVMVGTYFFIDYKYGSFSNMFVGETTETTTEETTEKIEIKNMQGKKNALIAVTSPGESELYNIFMVGINMTDNTACFLSVPVYTVDSAQKTLLEEFKIGGISQVEYVLERQFDMDFDCYFCATQNGFKFFLTELGKGVRFTVPQNLQFSTTNYTVSLKQGEQELSFDTFVKLMLFEEWKGEKNATFTVQAELIKELFSQYFKHKYITRDVDKYNYRMSHIKTDISSEDYVNDLDALEYIAATKISLKVLTPQGSFTAPGGENRFTFSKKSTAQIHRHFILTPKQ